MFIGIENLTTLLKSSNVINPFEESRIKNGCYELSLGDQVFQTDTKPRSVKNLIDNQEIYIEPGQFALLLTLETVKIPENKIAFISIKAGIKFKGLINVSGFHVDPGFQGKLLFSVYNAGPSTIILNRGKNYFPIWFAELNEVQDYKGNHDNQNKIPNEPIEALSQGELASPNVLSRRINDLKHLKTKIEWVFLAILTVAIGICIKIWIDSSNLKEAVEYGYSKRMEEAKSDSINKVMKEKIRILDLRIDSLEKNKNISNGTSPIK